MRNNPNKLTGNNHLTGIYYHIETFSKYLLSIESTKQVKFKESLYQNAARYAKLRADWYLADNEERLNMETQRKIAHDAFIDDCNILSRQMIKNGENANWRKELGNDRKIIGDFACFICYALGIMAR